MSYDADLSDLHRRLDDLESRLAEKEGEIAKNGPIPSYHRARIDEIYAQARATRQKLSNSKETTWASVKGEVEADWQALTASYQNWIERVDQDYR